MLLSDAVYAVADDVDVPLTASDFNKLKPLFSSVGLNLDDSRDIDPFGIAHAWRIFLDSEAGHSSSSDWEQIFLIGVLRHVMMSIDADWVEAFSAVRMRANFSLFEMNKRLGGRLFTAGRNLSVRGRDVITAVKLLKAALRIFEQVTRSDLPKSVPLLRMLHGMKGVALVLLSRSDSDTALLSQAEEALERSHQLGDSTPQNLAYRRECARREYNKTNDSSVLDRLERLLGESCLRDSQFYADLAYYHQDRASRALDLGEGDFSTHYDAAIAASTAGLSAPARDGEGHAIFHNLRGFMHYLAAQPAAGLEREQVLAELQDAVADLRLAAKAGLGGACLPLALLRRSSMLKATDLAEARADLSEASAGLGLADQDVASRLGTQIRASLLDCAIREALGASEADGLLETCQQLLALGVEGERHIFSILKALHFCWSLQKEGKESPSPALRSASEQVLATCLSVLESEPMNEHVALVIANAAGLSRRLDGEVVSDRTLALFRAGVESQVSPSASFLSQAADAALGAAKARARAGQPREAEAHFEDSVKRFQAAFDAAEQEQGGVPAGFLPVVAHSKAGEAFLRLRGGSLGSRTSLDQAIRHFEIAMQLGNNTPELCGLLGDAFYRRGYHSRIADDLRKALEMKLKAQALGHESRENFSVAARIHQRLFELEGDETMLCRAIEASIMAQRTSQLWPWPLFQLAEFARLPEPVRRNAAEKVRADMRGDLLVSWFADGSRAQLLKAAVEVAYRGDEFTRRELGGRSHVFVLDDPHELLSTTMVLKPTRAANAARETSTTRNLREYLRKNELLGRFALPIPFATLPLDGDRVIYAMERARADGLERVIVGDDERGYGGREEVRAALEFLAHFHAWADGGPTPPRPLTLLTAKFTEYVTELTSEPRDRKLLVAGFRRLTTLRLPFARKKDAHPENWLVTEGGKILMIDLESSAPQPCLLDVVQLLDDYPVFPPDSQGWRERMTLCHAYWRQLFGASVDPDLIETGYSVLALYRCAFGLSYCAREGGKRTASSALRSLVLRRNHFDDLLHYLEEDGCSGEIRKMAGLMRRSRPVSETRRLAPDESPGFTMSQIEI